MLPLERMEAEAKCTGVEGRRRALCTPCLCPWQQQQQQLPHLTQPVDPAARYAHREPLPLGCNPACTPPAAHTAPHQLVCEHEAAVDAARGVGGGRQLLQDPEGQRHHSGRGGGGRDQELVRPSLEHKGGAQAGMRLSIREGRGGWWLLESTSAGPGTYTSALHKTHTDTHTHIHTRTHTSM